MKTFFQSASKSLSLRILLVEDEIALIELLNYNLCHEGFQVDIARNGEEALLFIDESPPDLILLDWMLPEISGIEICRRLRVSPITRNIPIIMLTARAEESDRIRGLDTGADDYIVKPFSMMELMARIRSVMRRANPKAVEDVLYFGDIILDKISYRVSYNGSEIKLGPTEFRLLNHFMEQPGRVFSREQLLTAVWGDNIHVETRTVDVHIGRLRKALRDKMGTDPIRTVRSAGYGLKPLYENKT